MLVEYLEAQNRSLNSRLPFALVGSSERVYYSHGPVHLKCCTQFPLCTLGPHCPICKPCHPCFCVGSKVSLKIFTLVSDYLLLQPCVRKVPAVISCRHRPCMLLFIAALRNAFLPCMCFVVFYPSLDANPFQFGSRIKIVKCRQPFTVS